MKKTQLIVSLLIASAAMISCSNGAPAASNNDGAQTGTGFSLMSGSPTERNMGGHYGALGVSDVKNIPGARFYGAGWSDLSGNLWLFGGAGYDSVSTKGMLNDMWKYNPITKQWTWMNGSSKVNESGAYGDLGVSNPANNPGARFGGASWIDSAGNFWLFGGTGYSSTGNQGALNDLWKYNPITKQWTWVRGARIVNQRGGYGQKSVPRSGNLPGARFGSVGWSDSTGNFWLFGGTGYGSTESNGALNDMWEYNPTTKQWTWMNGSSSVNQSGVYGKLGVADSANNPGARFGSTKWTDSAGNLWLFGGSGYDSKGSYGALNDLWKYNPRTKQWTWMNGSSSVNQSGVYGKLGSTASSNTPGARYDSVGWIDSSGNLWMFGGVHGNSNGSDGRFNDLWKYNIVSQQWIWVKGSTSVDQNSVYDTLGKHDPKNIPSARFGSTSWSDSTGKFWLFGGIGSGISTDSIASYGDLWAFRN